MYGVDLRARLMNVKIPLLTVRPRHPHIPIPWTGNVMPERPATGLNKMIGNVVDGNNHAICVVGALCVGAGHRCRGRKESAQVGANTAAEQCTNDKA